MKTARPVVGLLALALACGRDERLAPLRTELYLAGVDTVYLDERAKPISDVTHLDIRDGWGIVIVDRPARAVRLYRRDGTFERELPHGEGPGELADPSSVAIMADGTIAVGESGQQRVATYRWDGAFAGSLEIPPVFAQRLTAAEDGTLFVGVRDVNQMSFLAFRKVGGRLISLGERLRWDPRVSKTPYWGSVALDYACAIGDSIAVVNSLLFDVRWMSASSGAAPLVPTPSWWHTPPVLRQRSLSGVGGRRALADWLGTLTVADGIARSGSILAISVAKYPRRRIDRLRALFTTQAIAWSLYSLDSGQHVADIVAPGRLVGGGEYFWTAQPADTLHGWRLVGYSLISSVHQPSQE